jgi:hypothetical protein
MNGDKPRRGHGYRVGRNGIAQPSEDWCIDCMKLLREERKRVNGDESNGLTREQYMAALDRTHCERHKIL